LIGQKKQQQKKEITTKGISSSNDDPCQARDKSHESHTSAKIENKIDLVLE